MTISRLTKFCTIAPVLLVAYPFAGGVKDAVNQAKNSSYAESLRLWR